jgi:hypothetical protein
MMRDRYPELHQFFGGYYHQDWRMDHSTTEAVLHSFIGDSAPHERAMISAQLREVLALSDAQLADAVFDLGAYYDPTPDGQTMREWLQAALNALASTL